VKDQSKRCACLYASTRCLSKATASCGLLRKRADQMSMAHYHCCMNQHQYHAALTSHFASPVTRGRTERAYRRKHKRELWCKVLCC
jgi:hypothetical protein